MKRAVEVVDTREVLLIRVLLLLVEMGVTWVILLEEEDEEATLGVFMHVMFDIVEALARLSVVLSSSD